MQKAEGWRGDFVSQSAAAANLFWRISRQEIR
jgi:hypothetical protein